MPKLSIGIWIAIIVAALASIAMIVWLIWPSPPPPAGSATELNPVTRIEKVETIKLVPKYITVYKERAKAEAGLPASVQSDPDQYVIASGHLDAEQRPYTLSAVFNAGSGASAVYAMPEPDPWLAMETHGEAGITYGFKSGTPTWRLTTRQNLVQIKASRLGAVASLDQDGEWYAGLGIFYRW